MSQDNAVETEKIESIMVSYENLRAGIAALGSNIDDLVARLAPVLLPQDDVKGDVPMMSSAASDVRDILDGMQRSVARLRETVRDATNRVDL